MSAAKEARTFLVSLACLASVILGAILNDGVAAKQPYFWPVAIIGAVGIVILAIGASLLDDKDFAETPK